MSNPPLVLSVAALLLAMVAILVAVFRRRSAVTMGLQTDLDLAVEQNKRLTAELAQTKDELHTALVKVTPELLANHARHGVAYAEQMGGTPEQKWRHAVDASIISDKGANGVQDWTDAQHRIAVEVAVLELNTKAGK